MAPFYGNNAPPPADVVPDWLLGGNRKRRVLEALTHPAEPEGSTADELAKALGIGRSTVFEMLRALRRLDVLLEEDGRARLDVEGTALGKAIGDLLEAVEPYADTTVDRPPRPRTGHRQGSHRSARQRSGG